MDPKVDKSLFYLEPNTDSKPKVEDIGKGLGPSSALQRAKMFLPMLKQSNIEIEEKAKEDPNSVIIENVNGEDPHYSLIPIDEELLLNLETSSEEGEETSSEEDSDNEPYLVEVETNAWLNGENENGSSK